MVLRKTEFTVYRPVRAQFQLKTKRLHILERQTLAIELWHIGSGAHFVHSYSNIMRTIDFILGYSLYCHFSFCNCIQLEAPQRKVIPHHQAFRNELGSITVKASHPRFLKIICVTVFAFEPVVPRIFQVCPIRINEPGHTVSGSEPGVHN